MHPEILRSEGLPDALLDEKRVWRHRYRFIVDMERHLHENGTRIIKFFFPSRRTSSENAFWIASMEKLEIQPGRYPGTEILESIYGCIWERLSATSTECAPWHVVPAYDKESARLILSQIILESFDKLKMSYPKTTATPREELLTIRKRFAADVL